MKGVKIGLVVIVLGVIGFYVWKWSIDDASNLGDGNAQVEGTNQFVQDIQNDIDSLRTLSKKDFSKDYFKQIQGELDDFYQGGNLGDNSFQNDREYENLSKTLFATYVPKVVDEAYYKFRQSNWMKSDLNYIRDEIKEVESNQFFDVNTSSYVSRFDTIESIISKYYEIDAFIDRCHKYPPNLEYSVDDRFPIDEVAEKIDQSKIYLTNDPGYGYISNEVSLRTALKEIPNQMYLKHFDFLTRQIQVNSGKFKSSSLESQADYSNEIYQPLKRSLDEFDNDVYGVNYNPEFLIVYNKLKTTLDDDNDSASAYFKKRLDEEIKNQISK